jgi:hypothetical protein
MSLRQSASRSNPAMLVLGIRFVTENEFDRIVQPTKLVKACLRDRQEVEDLIESEKQGNQYG